MLFKAGFVTDSPILRHVFACLSLHCCISHHTIRRYLIPVTVVDNQNVVSVGSGASLSGRMTDKSNKSLYSLEHPYQIN